MRTPKSLGRVIFIRHGESIWNVTDPSRGLVTRFTGWADVPLTARGRYQAAAAGRCLKTFNIKPDAIFTSLLSRSKDTYKEILNVYPALQNVPLVSSWRLNERHYGALVGLSKDEAGRKLGAERVMEWRRSWEQAPPPMDQEDLMDLSQVAWGKPITEITHPGKNQIVTVEKGISVPRTESLADCFNRVLPLWKNGIAPRVARGETVLIVAHANSIRSMVKHIDVDTMTVTSVRDVHIPSATPLVYSFEARESLSGCAASIKPMGDPTQLGMTGRYIATKEIVRLALESHICPAVTEASRISKTSSSSSPPSSSIRSTTKTVSSTHLEDTHSSHYDDSSSFYDLIDKGLTEIIEYANTGQGQKDALIITDGRGYIVHSNQAWENLCGFHIDEIRGKTNEFLQGPLTSPSIVSSLNQEVQSGLPVQTQLINYRKSGVAFENKITIIPVYSWLSEEAEENKKMNSNNTNQSNHCSSNDEDDESEKNSLSQRDLFLKKPLPSHFVAKLDITPDDHALPPLTEEQMAKRGLNPRKTQDDVNA